MSHLGEISSRPTHRPVFVAATPVFQPDVNAGVIAQLANIGSKKISILKVFLNFNVYDGTSQHAFHLAKYSSATTGGTPLAGTVTALDGTDTTSGIGVQGYTAKPTEGAIIGGPVGSIIAGSADPAHGANFIIKEELFSADKFGKALMLNSGSEWAGVKFTGNIFGAPTPCLAQVTFVLQEN